MCIIYGKGERKGKEKKAIKEKQLTNQFVKSS